MKHNLQNALLVLLLLATLFFGVADSVWKWKNPKANDMTFWTHFSDVVHFRRLAEFQ